MVYKRQMKKSTITSLYVIGLALIVLIWYLVSFFYDEANLVFPGPVIVFKRIVELLKKSSTYKYLITSISKTLIGYLISLFVAIVLASLASIDNKIRYILAPLWTFIKSIPTACLVFLFLVIFTVKRTPIYIVILISMPILYDAMLSGYDNIDVQIIDTLKLEKIDEITKLIKISFPLAFKQLLVGVASSLALSFKIEIMAEVLSGDTRNGIGSAISYIEKADPTNMLDILAYGIIVVLFSTVVDYLIKTVSKQ